MSRPEDESVLEAPGGEGRALDALKTVLEHIPEALFLVRPDGREILACNPATEELLGYGCDELLGRSTEVLHVDREHFEEFGRLSEGVLQRGETFFTDWQLRRKDGSVVATSHSVSLIDENLGLGGGVVSLVRERDSLRSAASQLEELRGRYDTLFDRNPEAMLVYDLADGRLLEANAALAEIYGGEPESLVGRSLDELVVEEDQGRLLELMERREQLLRDGERDGRLESRWRVRRHDGSIRTVRVSAAPVVFDSRPARLVVVSDITERLEAERRAQRLLTILDATPDLVGIADPEERVQYINPAGRRLVGREGLEVRDTPMAEYMTRESMELLRSQGIPSALRDGVWTGQTALRHRSGEEIPVSQVVIAHRDSDTGAPYLSTIARDMREHLELEEQLRQSQKIEAIGRLAGGVAHDFNNILTALGGYADLALEKVGDRGAVERYLREIKAASDRAADLTRQLLAFSRRQVFQARVLDLGRVVQETEGILRAALPETIELEIRRPEGEVLAQADRSQLQQVLLNLAVNARDAMPDGGVVTVEVEHVDLDSPRSLGPVEVSEGRWGVLRMIDDGIGMEPDLVPRIFEPFFTTKRPGEGTGLGLSTVYGIVKQSGGYVQVDSEPGRGTTFSVYLPAAEGEPVPAAEEAQGATEGEGRSARVLLVEDDRAARMFLHEVLDREGYEVLEADCAQEALEMTAELDRPVDLLVSDVVLPKMDGRELSDRMRRQNPELPVVLISGYSYESLGTELETEEWTAFLQKPFSGEELLDQVRRLLERSREL